MLKGFLESNREYYRKMVATFPNEPIWRKALQDTESLLEASVKTKDTPFWKRAFPQLYRCKNCGEYALMKKPEPWAGHLCGLPADFWRLSESEKSRILRETPMGGWDFIAEGDKAKEIYQKYMELKCIYKRVCEKSPLGCFKDYGDKMRDYSCLVQLGEPRR